MTKGVNFKISATNAAGPAFRSAQAGLAGIRRQAAMTSGTMRSWNAGLNSNRRAVQQLGFQMSDFAIQIAGGQSAMLAFTQQGGQMLQFFGPAGSIMAMFLAIFGSLAIAFIGSGRALSDLFPLMGVLQEEFRWLAEAIRVVTDVLIDFANVLVNNLDTIIITAAVAAGYFGVRWVAGMIAASAASWSFVGALVAVRTALLRLGLPAVIIATGYLIERFLALVQGAGSFGNAMQLLGNLVRAVVADIDIILRSLVWIMDSVASGMVAAFMNGLAAMLDAVDDFMDAIISGPFNTLMGALGFDLAISSSRAMQGTLRGVAAEYSAMAGASNQAASAAWEGATRTKEAWEAVQDAMSKGDTNVDIRDWFGGGDAAKKGKDGGGGGGGAKEKAAKAAKDIETIFENLQKTIGESLLSNFKALTQRTKSFVDAAKDMLGTLADKLIDILLTPVFNNIAGGIAGRILGGMGGAPMPSFAGGGYTGSGPRSGGVDGKGGFHAILHPNETVTDHTRGGGQVEMSASQLTISDDGKIMATVQAWIVGSNRENDRRLPGKVMEANSSTHRRRRN